MAFAPLLVGLDSPEVETLRLIACTLDERARRMTSVASPLMVVVSRDSSTGATTGTAGLLMGLSLTVGATASKCTRWRGGVQGKNRPIPKMGREIYLGGPVWRGPGAGAERSRGRFPQRGTAAIAAQRAQRISQRDERGLRRGARARLLRHRLTVAARLQRDDQTRRG